MDTGRRALRYVIWTAVVLAGGLLFIKFLLPCLLPFILAFLTAAICEPVVRYLSEKLNLRRGIASALSVLVILLSLVGFFLLVIVRLANEAIDFINELPELASGLPKVLDGLERSVRRFIAGSPDSMRGYLEAALESINARAAEIPAALSSKALESLSSLAAGAPAIVLFCATYAIGSFFISVSYVQIRAFIARQIPERFRLTAHNIKSDLLDGVGKWLRAQAALMLVTFLELTLAFMFLRVEYAAVIALITAVIDALPVLGTGVVLLPWAAVLLIGGNTGRALALLIVYLIATLVRNLLEPKLVGDQFGVNPAAALLAMYTGFKLCGVAGMILFPFGLMMLNQINSKGYIKLWK